MREDDIRRSTHFTDLLREVNRGRPDMESVINEDALALSEAKTATRMARLMEKKVCVLSFLRGRTFSRLHPVLT